MLRGIPAAALLGLAVWALLLSLVYLLGCTDPLPAAGMSYWGDHRRDGHDPETAAQLAARDMGAVLASLHAVQR